MTEPDDNKPVDAEAEEMIELQELVRAQDAKGQAKPDETDGHTPPTRP